MNDFKKMKLMNIASWKCNCIIKDNMRWKQYLYPHKSLLS